MSYSFSVRAASKQALKDAAAAKIAEQVATQQPHVERDIEMIRATCSGMVDSLDEPGEGRVLVLECYGSISGTWEDGAFKAYTSNNISCKAYLAFAAA